MPITLVLVGRRGAITESCRAPLAMAEPSGDPVVSVLCICGDHGRFVGECLRSLDAQTWPEMEVLVLDNASSDDSLAVIDAWAATTPLRHRVIRQATREGVCRNFNTLFAEAAGEYFCLLAADDALAPEKFDRQVRLLQSSPPDVAVVYSDAVQIDEDGGPLPGLFVKSHRKRDDCPEGDVLGELLKGNWIPAHGALTRRSAWMECGPWDESLVYEDWDMWLRLAARYRFRFDEVPSAVYRIVSTSLSRVVLHRPVAATRWSVAAIKARASAFETIPLWERYRLLAGALEELAAMEPGDWPRPGQFQSLYDLSGEPVFLAAARGTGEPEPGLLASRAAELRKLEATVRSGAKALASRTAGKSTPAPGEASGVVISTLRPKVPASGFRGWVGRWLGGGGVSPDRGG